MKIPALFIALMAVSALAPAMAVAQLPAPQIESLVLGEVENCHMAGGCRADVLLTYSLRGGDSDDAIRLDVLHRRPDLPWPTVDGVLAFHILKNLGPEHISGSRTIHVGNAWAAAAFVYESFPSTIHPAGRHEFALQVYDAQMRSYRSAPVVLNIPTQPTSPRSPRSAPTDNVGVNVSDKEGLASALTELATIKIERDALLAEVLRLEEALAAAEAANDALSRLVDTFVQSLPDGCTDEYEQALAYATSNGFDSNYAAPAQWDGTPFVVDISSTFPNADDLLEVIGEEADRVYEALGYEIFVPGDVLPLGYIQEWQLIYLSSAYKLIPPAQHIHVRCCYDTTPESAGVAYPWWRVMLLENDAFQSRHIITHELYHLLGFSHPGDSQGIVMSDSLMYGPGLDENGRSYPTAPLPSEVAKLGCIYDDPQLTGN